MTNDVLSKALTMQAEITSLQNQITKILNYRSISEEAGYFPLQVSFFSHFPHINKEDKIYSSFQDRSGFREEAKDREKWKEDPRIKQIEDRFLHQLEAAIREILAEKETAFSNL